MRLAKYLASLAVLAFLTSACGDSSSPGSPSSIPAGTSAGAVVTGTVQSGAGVAASTGAAAASITVEVVGTGITATTGPLGEFTLSAVPAGQVELRFRGSGTDARLSIGQISSGETVRIVVTVSGSSAVLRTEDRSGSGNGEVRASGSVERLTGSAASFTFFIGTREVRGGSSTQFSGQGPSALGFANLRNGGSVEVRGTLSGDALLASQINLRGNDADDDDDDEEDDDNDDNDEDEFEGRITAMTGTAPNLTLTVAGRAVVTTSATVVRRRGNEVGFGALAVQQLVEVEGTPRTGGGITAEKITIEDDDDDDDEDDDRNEVRVEGGVSGLSSLASCPSVTFTVSGQRVATSGSTRFDDVSCAGLANGMEVEVRGVRQSNGTIAATRVKRD